MKEINDTNDETIDTLLTEDYADKKYQKKKKKELKKAKKQEKKKQKQEKKAYKINEDVPINEEKPNTITKKRILIEASIIAILLILLTIVVLRFIPRIWLNGDKYVKIEYGEHYVDDGCFARYRGEYINDKIWYEGEVDEEKVGKYVIKCKVRKNRFVVTRERIVEVVDTKKPIIDLIGDLEKNICPNTKYEEEGFTASDNYDGELTSKVKREDNDTEIIYSVSDSSGNIEKVTRKIIKEDKTAPEIKLNGNETVYVTVGGSYSEQGVTVVDNCDGELNDSVKTEGNVDTNTTGTYTITYSVTDKAGNIGTKERKVVVQKQASKVSGSLGCGNAGTIYLTFDDGPHGSYTPYILDVLKKYNVKATFFVLGSLANSYPNILKREVNEGHAVGIHTWSHDYAKIYKSTSAFWDEVNKTHDVIKSTTGYDSKLIRFPGGASNTVSRKYSTGIMSTLAREVVEKGYNYFDWNLSSGDAGGVKNATEELNNVVRSLSKSRGNVILMHDIKTTTKDAIESIVKYGLDNGYTFDVLNTSIQCKQSTNN